MPGTILVVEDDPHMQYTLREALKARGVEAQVVSTAEAALARLRSGSFDAVLLDVMLEGMSGMDALPLFLRSDPQMPVIMMTAYGTREMAYKALKAGAYDFFEKPFKVDELAVVVRRALERRQLTREVSQLVERLGEELRIENLVAHSGAMKPVLDGLRAVVGNDVTVLLRGENGTGKTLLAKVIHENSLRRRGPFVTVACGLFPETLLESELFGYEAGAFTGAVRSKPGRLEAANGGTILLDEIGDISPAIQAKLLRFLETCECERLGGTETVCLDVRIIAATNKDLERAVADGSFRQDLYYRLNVFPIVLPPLRERAEDIRPLAERFLDIHARKHNKAIKGFSPEAMEALLGYHWPGNVREMDHVVQAAVLRSQGDVVDVDCLPADVVQYRLRAPEKPQLQRGQSLDDLVASIEKQLILDALRRTGGVQARAASLLGISGRSLWHRVKKYGINIEKIKNDTSPPPP